jgi:hypothetical protein
MSQDESHRAKLMRLADALMEDVLSASDEDILAGVDIAHIERGRTILVEVKACVSQQFLGTARTQLEDWRSLRLREAGRLDKFETKERFEQIQRDDPVFKQKMTIAARNGKAPTDNDKEGLVEDLTDLQRLEDEDTIE